MASKNLIGSTPRRDGLWLFLFGCLVLAGTWFEYEDLTAFEVGTRATIRMNYVMRLLYGVSGKWGVIVTMASAGCALVAWGAKKLVVGR